MGYLRHTQAFLGLATLLKGKSFVHIPTPFRAMSTQHDLVMDAFCIRQFNNSHYTGTQINFDVNEFEVRVNEYYKAGSPLVDGYAPFW